ncbi:sialate O-acetylesterase [Pedobacter sp. LMG 31464]|uniref:Sialate O-acetylesterase n=1 Tax=Pedobacter planticolens TaxID=2679964 RepID=A0A923DVX4_9SPHI|nr:sialate O-acetylesterase [Pedobacter planticolens]MBB2144917.1 sialate O-acetylesterase [Pedobacter planticolens]
MKRYLTVVSLLLLCGIQSIKANVVLPAIFGNGMVLQQKENVKVWGKAKLNANVLITTSWNNKTYTVKTNASGNWKTTIATPTAGGPYSITFNDGNKITLSDILIGEVWLCSGQSNMEMPIKGFGNQPILNSNDILLDAEEPGVRLFRIEKNMSRTPVADVTNKWEHANAVTVKEFSAIGYQFARMLQQKLKVPVGIIQSAYGGTDIEAWMTKNSLTGFTDFKTPADSAKVIKNDPAVLFNAMIIPIIGYNIKGVLWYQGENNRMNPLTYAQKMAAMVKEWRTQWATNQWPFYYVQIAPNVYNDHKEEIPLLYEAQAQAMTLIPNSGMVVSVDAGSQTTIHPPNKTIISKRLAYWALAKTYGKEGIAYMGPVYKSLKITDDKVILSFDQIPTGLTAFDQKLKSFEIAGEDKVFYPADAAISGKTVVVKSESVKKPVAVRYAFKDNAVGNLYNVEGLPSAPFRTDNWDNTKP